MYDPPDLKFSDKVLYWILVLLIIALGVFIPYSMVYFINGVI